MCVQYNLVGNAYGGGGWTDDGWASRLAIDQKRYYNIGENESRSEIKPSPSRRPFEIDSIFFFVCFRDPRVRILFFTIAVSTGPDCRGRQNDRGITDV